MFADQQPSKHEVCCLNVCPQFASLAQLRSSIVPECRVCWVLCHNKSPNRGMHCHNTGTMLGQRIYRCHNVMVAYSVGLFDQQIEQRNQDRFNIVTGHLCARCVLNADWLNDSLCPALWLVYWYSVCRVAFVSCMLIG